jgi:hypothetical protein
MRTSKTFKAKREFTRHKLRTAAAKRFSKNHGTDGIYTDHLLSPSSQWCDFSFLHPKYRHLIAVCVRTLPFAYNDLCELATDTQLENTPKPWLASFNSSFLKSSPIYVTPKGSTRPRIKYFRLTEMEPYMRNMRDEFYKNRAALLNKNMNSGEFTISSSMNLSVEKYGWWVDLIVDKPNIQESDFPLYRDIIVGSAALEKSTKTFSNAEVRACFGFDSDTPSSAPIIQPVGIK